jgi:phage FluMu gp28-like protein
MKLRSQTDDTWRQYRDSVLASLPSTEARAIKAWSSTFYPFQQRWLWEPERFAIANKSRQTGFSHTTGGLGTLWAAAFGETTTFVSVGEREALEVLDKAEKHALLMADLGSKWARAKKRGGELKFASGGRVIALPRSSGGRGFSGNVFLDEWAYGDHTQEVWDAAAPVILHGYQLRVASTPNGVGNMFHDLWANEESSPGWAGHIIPLRMALDDGMRVDVDDCWRMARGDPRLFAQMFECQFLDGADQYIPTALLNAATKDWRRPSPNRILATFAGLDIGRNNDLTCLVIIGVDASGIAFVLNVETLSRTEPEDIDRLAATAFSQWGVTRLVVDATGLGEFPAASLRKRHGLQRVEPYTFTLQTKEHLATLLYQDFAEEKVKYPPDQKQLTEDVASIRRIVTDAGNVRYDAPRTDKGHADRAWALSLALHGCRGPDRKRHEVIGA